LNRDVGEYKIIKKPEPLLAQVFFM